MTTLALAPFHLDGVPGRILLPLAIGFAFGFTLERSGFGDARRLAAQFYFREIRVLKVMFTAIVTCMLLLLWASALGFLDLDAIWVNPTYLASGVLGGLVLGIGFIVGGYCPGTSIVSAATLKIDGAIFLGGVGVGSLVFGETADGFRAWYDGAGSLGRVTLPEWLGLPAGVVAALVVAMALFMFWGGEWLERRFGGGSRPAGAGVARAPRTLWRPAVRGGGVALLAVLLLALGLPAVGQPTVEDRLGRMESKLDAELSSRAVHLDPGEVLGLLHNEIGGRLARFRLVLLDVRPESDFNLFHLVDARCTSLDALAAGEARVYAGPAYAKAVKVVVSNDEREAERAWKLLRAAGTRDAYVLAGGMNLWLEVFEHHRLDARPAAAAEADETLRHAFAGALGARHPAARPARPVLEALRSGGTRTWESRVQPVVKAPKASGGCG